MPHYIIDGASPNLMNEMHIIQTPVQWYGEINLFKLLLQIYVEESFVLETTYYFKLFTHNVSTLWRPRQLCFFYVQIVPEV